MPKPIKDINQFWELEPKLDIDKIKITYRGGLTANLGILINRSFKIGTILRAFDAGATVELVED